MKEILTAVLEQSPQGYIGYVEELPGANTQGKNLRDTSAMLRNSPVPTRKAKIWRR